MDKISVTLLVTASQLAQIAAVMGAEGSVEPEAEKPAPRTRKPKEDTPADTGKGAEVKGKDAAGDEVDELPSTDDVAAAAKKLVAKNGRDALVEMLGKYDAKQISGVAEGDRARFIEACEEAVG